jgi:hypothetical protein
MKWRALVFRVRRSTCIVMAFVLGGCGKSPSTERLDQCRDTLRHADRVAVHRIGPQLGQRSAPDSIAGHPILAGPVEAGYRFNAQEVAYLLADTTDTNWPGLRCPFSPVVAVSFFRGTNRVEALLCFLCNEFRVFDASGQVGGNDFATRRGTLLVFVWQVFPNDEAITMLPLNQP